MSEETNNTIPSEITESASPVPPFPARYARFGNFQVDLQRQEVSRSGKRLRMQGKVYQTLLVLLSRAGDVVTRDEVRQRLWPEHFPESGDASVNTAMNKLRQALEDSAENPAYVETIPRRGYSFVAPVEFSDLAEPAAMKSGEVAGQMLPGRGTLEAARLWWLSSLLTPLRMASLVLAGMVVGALLVLAWFSHHGGSHKVQNSGKQVASQPAGDLDHLLR